MTLPHPGFTPGGEYLSSKNGSCLHGLFLFLMVLREEVNSL
jgi:hypothetical protein